MAEAPRAVMRAPIRRKMVSLDGRRATAAVPNGAEVQGGGVPASVEAPRSPILPRSVEPLTAGEAALLGSAEAPQFSSGMAGEALSIIGRRSAVGLAYAENASSRGNLKERSILGKMVRVGAIRDLSRLQDRMRYKAKLNTRDREGLREKAQTPHDRALAYDLDIEMTKQSIASYNEALAAVDTTIGENTGGSGIRAGLKDLRMEKMRARYDKQRQLHEENLARLQDERAKIVDDQNQPISNQMEVMARDFMTKAHPGMPAEQLEKTVHESPSNAMVNMVMEAVDKNTGPNADPSQYNALLAAMKESGMSPGTLSNFENAVDIYAELSPLERTTSMARKGFLYFLLLGAAGMYIGKKKADADAGQAGAHG